MPMLLFLSFWKCVYHKLYWEQDYTLNLSIWRGWAKRNTWTWVRFFSFFFFFWEHQSWSFFDVGSKTVTKKILWYLSYTPQLLPYLLFLVLPRAGLALAPLFFLQPTDIFSIFSLRRIEQGMTLLGFQLIPTSTHTLNWKKIFRYKSSGRKKEDVVWLFLLCN